MVVILIIIIDCISDNWKIMSFIEENQRFKLWTIRSVWFVVSILLILNSQIYCIKSLCKSLPDLKPCKCLQNSIECNNIQGDFHLENISQILDSKRNSSVFAEFSLYNTSIKKIGNVFKSVAFELISISDNKNMTQISDKAFSGSRESLDIINVLENDNFSNLSTDQNLIFDLMTQFKSIRYILLPKNAISSLSNRVFHSNYDKFVSFSYLNLRENNITRIESKTFIDLPKLQSINFIGESAFVLIANITTAFIAIDSNKLNSSSFASNWFSLKLVKTSANIDIDLSHNNIEYLDQQIFETILSPKYNIVLTLRYNPFKCDCRSKWLFSNKNLFESKVRWMTCEDKKDIWLKTQTDFANCSSK